MILLSRTHFFMHTIVTFALFGMPKIGLHPEADINFTQLLNFAQCKTSLKREALVKIKHLLNCAHCANRPDTLSS